METETPFKKRATLNELADKVDTPLARLGWKVLAAVGAVIVGWTILGAKQKGNDFVRETPIVQTLTERSIANQQRLSTLESAVDDHDDDLNRANAILKTTNETLDRVSRMTEKNTILIEQLGKNDERLDREIERLRKQ